MSDDARRRVLDRLSSLDRERRDVHLRDLFDRDPDRFDRHHAVLNGVLVDWSKQRVDDVVLDALVDLAAASGVPAKVQAMFAGDKINVTEDRPVLHVALRRTRRVPIVVDGRDVMPDVHAVLDAMRRFASDVRDGVRVGRSGKRFRHVVNVGIGGSDLGPKMVTRALSPYATDSMTFHYVSNVDPSDLTGVLRAVDPDETLFLIVSKTFTTLETMRNAEAARAWFVDRTGDPAAVRDHFVAISTNLNATQAFGIDPASTFGFWDWVGGRYSLWSAVGLSTMIAIGPQRFDELLAGAEAVDEHLRSAPLHANVPVLLAMIGIWNQWFLGASTYAVLPYDHLLADLPAYLQQADMESNGKHVDVHGRPVQHDTGPIVWGAPGTNGQHAFFQLLHQGTRLVPSDFLVAATSPHPVGDQHALLVANAFAQTEALMRGRTVEEARARIDAQGAPSDPDDAGEARRAHLAAATSFPGNKPSTTFLYPRLDPTTLGTLLAIFEHRIFVQGIVYGVDSFDQMGVELGKVLAQQLSADLDADAGEVRARHDRSTAGLIAAFQAMRRRER